MYLAGHRVRCVCLAQMINESPHALNGEMFHRCYFQCRCLGDRQEAEEPTPAHPKFVQSSLGQPSTRSIAEGIITPGGVLPEAPVRYGPMGERQMQPRSRAWHHIYS